MSRSYRIRILIITLSLVATVWIAFDRHANAQNAKELTPQERRGKQIYLKGESEGGEIMATLGSSDLDLPGTSFPCVNCHGLRGEGGDEGGLKPAPINWEALTSPHESALTGSKRGPYNEATLNRAITLGIDASANRLHPGMPHYRMTRAQMDDLIAYLKKIGKEADADPGLSEDEIKVGAALPMTGQLARIGEDVKAALEAYFKEVNAQGGIYGRRFELVVEDSRGDVAGTTEATKKLVEQDKVFALVGSYEPARSSTTNDYLKQQEVPLIGPVTLSPRPPTIPNRFVFYLLPSFSDQTRALVDFISSEEMQAKGKAAKRIAVVLSESDFDQDALAGVKAQAKLDGIQIVAEQSYKAGKLSASMVVASIAKEKPDYVFFFGNGDDFVAFANEIDRAKLDAGLLGSSIMAGRGAFTLPASVAARTFLAYPASLPTREEFEEFVTVMQKANANIRSAAFQSVAFAAAKILVEATRNGSRQMSRAVLINSLEGLRDFRTGVVPPVTFGPNRRVGAAGSYIVGVDIVNKRYVPVSERVVPKGSQ